MFSNTPSDFFWIGDNPNKGLGVITFNNIKIEKYENYSDEFKYILPLVLTKNNEKIHLISVWTQIVTKG